MFQCVRRMSSWTVVRQKGDMMPIRNVGIIAHIDAGKTTLTERMLFYAGHTQRIGDVDSGNTVTDYLPAERARGITITAACIPLLWKGSRINLIDTPGHVDFTIEVERSVRVLDGAVVLLDAVAGVEAQTETVWRQANKQRIPRVLVANKMDREGASLQRAVVAVKQRLTGWGDPLILQWPIVSESSANPRKLQGVFCLAEMQVLDFREDESGSIVRKTRATTFDEFVEAISASRGKNGKGGEGMLEGIEQSKVEALWAQIEGGRVDLVERLAGLDDGVVDSFLGDADGSHLAVKPDVLKPAIRRLTLEGKLVPVFCASAFKNTGVQPIMDSIVDYLPCPTERPQPVATLLSTGDITQVSYDSKNFCALAFKIIHDERRGAMVFIRVYSGTLEPRTLLYNSTQNVTERATKILQMYADDYEEIPSVSAGNIACIIGLTETKTGDTLLIANQHGMTGSPTAGASKKGAIPSKRNASTSSTSAFTLETIHLPPPVFIRSVEPSSSSDARKLEISLTALSREDPSLIVTIDPDSGQTLLGGMGELHLEIAGERLRDTHKCAARMGKVAVSYRETIPMESGVLEGALEYDKEVFGKRGKVDVKVRVEGLPMPLDWVDSASTTEEGEDNGLEGVPGNLVDLSHLHFENGASMFPVPLLMVPVGRGKLEAKAPAGYPSIEEIEQAVRDGFRGALARGPLLGFPVLHLRVTLVDLKLYKPEWTSVAAVRAAVGRCVRDVMRGVVQGSGSKGASVVSPTRLLEPIMDLHVTVPEKYVGTVTKDLTGTRRGNVISLGSTAEESADGNRTNGAGSYEGHFISATVPLGSLLGYSTALRGMTAGTGVFGMKLLGYGRMSSDREEAVVKEMKGY